MQQLLVLKKGLIMFFQIRNTILLFCLATASIVSAQDTHRNDKSFEVGLNFAGDETLFYGAYGKFVMPLSQKKQHFTVGVSLTTYFDFKGESEKQAYLKHDADMRIIPNIFVGYSLNFKKIQINFEVPIGASIAITKGTLVNEKIGFKRDFSNTEVFLNYGFIVNPKYQLNSRNYIGLYGFLPLVSDKAQSGYQVGVGWTKTFRKKNN